MRKTNAVYEPDNSLKMGYLSLCKDIVNELIGNRWLIEQFFRKDFSASYKQSFIGVFWALIVPIISVGTFVLLRNSGLFFTGSLHIPYPLYAVLGMASWQLISSGLTAGSNSLIKAGPMIAKINFSKKSLVLASSLQGIIPFVIQLTLGIIMCFIYGIVPKWQALFTPILILPLMLLTYGLSLLLALLNGIIRDIANALNILLTFLLFMTPVLYVIPGSGMLSRIANLNPLSHLISVPRQFIIEGSTQQWVGFIFSSMVSFIVFLICLLAFHLTETRVAERI